MSFRLRAVAILSALLVIPALRASSSDSPQAIVRGIVRDQSTAPISGATIYFTHDGRKTPIRTSPDGSYSTKLAPGTYSVRVEDLGFCDGLRGEFLARDGSDVRLDFMLAVAAVTQAITSTYTVGRSSTVVSNISGCFEPEELAAPVKDGVRPLVLYARRVAEGDLVHYSGANGNSVVYTYDLLTVKATALEYSAKDHSIEGTGGVMWQDDKIAKNAAHIRVTFPNGKPQIDLID